MDTYKVECEECYAEVIIMCTDIHPCHCPLCGSENINLEHTDDVGLKFER